MTWLKGKTKTAFYHFLFCMVLLYGCRQDAAYTGWAQYKGGNEAIHYSSLTQIDTTNVQQLQVAWEYHTGDADTANHSQIQCNPIMVDGILYGTTPRLKLFAIDAATGKENWVFDPFDTLTGNKTFFNQNNCRGVTYWADGADKRIYYTAGNYVLAINAVTGKRIVSFADSGTLDLHAGLGPAAKDLFVTATSPGMVYNDLLIMGTRVSESPQAAPGHIRAYDIRTGKQRWIFHTIPQQGEYGYETWDDPTATQYIGGANAWGGFSLDKEKGILFAGTGSSNYDFYGGKRTGNNLFSNCILAIDAATGKRIWHFQYLHHDVWDRDLPAPPALVSIHKDGRATDAVAFTTKTGFVFVLERSTGKPVYDIIEKPVPVNTDLEGEKLSSTQPLPVKPAPFMRLVITENDLNTLLPDSSYQEVKQRWASYRNDNMFNPASLQGTLEFPGLDGGAEWGGPAYDPVTGMLYINANEMAWEVKAKPVVQTMNNNENYLQAGMRLYQANCMQCHGAEKKGSDNVPSLLEANTKYSAGSFDTLIQTGRRMMPAFKQLPDIQRKAIAVFVLGLQSEKTRLFKDTSTKKSNPFLLPYSISGIKKFLSKEGLPGIAPPWGTLNAINLNTGEYAWKKPLGNDTAFHHAGSPTGTENYGAPVVTAGGLVFIGATKDGMLRAFNKLTGAILWEAKLPAAAFATPAIYTLQGKQYVVIACGGGKLQTTSGDSYIAYALPK